MESIFDAVKKFLVSILTVLYITITSGVMVNIHYCMGEVAQVKYGAEKHETCNNCGMEKKEGCCKVEHHFIKASDQQVAAKYVVSQPLTIIADIPSSNDLLGAVDQNDHNFSLYYSPPDKRLNAIRKFNSVYRI